MDDGVLRTAAGIHYCVYVFPASLYPRSCSRQLASFRLRWRSPRFAICGAPLYRRRLRGRPGCSIVRGERTVKQRA